MSCIMETGTHALTAPAHSPNRLWHTEKLFISLSRRTSGTEQERLMTKLALFPHETSLHLQIFNFPSTFL